jgi:hypothetical protein
MAATNIPLKVPFKEKDEAKSLGARWNPEGKHWYVPEGVDATPFEKWLDGALPAVQTSLPIQTAANKTTVTLPAQADTDDINAMLRDAYEIGDDY